MSSYTVKQDFINNYESRKPIAIYFLPTFFNYTTCIIIEWFPSYIDNAMTNTQDVYLSSGLFILFEKLKYLYYSHLTLLIVFKSRIFVELNLL